MSVFLIIFFVLQKSKLLSLTSLIGFKLNILTKSKRIVKYEIKLDPTDYDFNQISGGIYIVSTAGKLYE